MPPAEAVDLKSLRGAGSSRGLRGKASCCVFQDWTPAARCLICCNLPRKVRRFDDRRQPRPVFNSSGATKHLLSAPKDIYLRCFHRKSSHSPLARPHPALSLPSPPHEPGTSARERSQKRKLRRSSRQALCSAAADCFCAFPFVCTSLGCRSRLSNLLTITMATVLLTSARDSIVNIFEPLSSLWPRAKSAVTMRFRSMARHLSDSVRVQFFPFVA